MRFSSTTATECLFVHTLFVLSCPAGTGQAIDSTLATYIKKNQQEVRVVNGQLQGTGADWLRQEAAKAQFFFVGEEHDLRAVPDLLGALWPDLLQAGYRHVALEAGQWLGNRLDTYTRFRDPKALSQFKGAALPRRPNVSVPPSSDEDMIFYSVLAEHRLPGQKSALIWGLDYEFKTTPLLQRLAELTPRTTVRRQIQPILSQVKAAEAAGQYAMVPFKKSILQLLHLFPPRAGTEIEYLRDALYRRVGRYPVTDRSEVMKRLFLRDYGATQRTGEHTPKVLLRFGSYHAKRGLMSEYGTSTLANGVAELALREGTTLFTLKIVCCSPVMSGSAGKPRPCTSSERVWLAPMLDQSLYPWTLYNLLPLREAIKQGKLTVGPELFEVITGFDAVLLIQTYEQSTFSSVSVPQY